VGNGAASWWHHLFITLLILAAVGLNMTGAKFVALAQSVIVLGVLVVFGLFIWVTVKDADFSMLAFSGYPSAGKILASVALTFFAYLGFNVITFAAGDLPKPAHDLPRAMYQALGITMVVYVLISLGVFGTLTVAQVIQYGERAIAEAARPALGDAGYTVMAVAALLSTTGATNATFYASGNLTGMLATEGLFPGFFGPASRLGRHAGLLITGGLVLLIANLADLSAIASVGSAVALLVFLLVGLAGYRLRRETASNTGLVVAAMCVTVVVIVSFAVDTWRTAPETFVAILGILVFAVVLDSWTRRSQVRGPGAPQTSA
jgi:amino acid transporter